MKEKMTFIDYLKQEYVSRCRNNAQYSLRAFARSLNVPASSLSLILNGARPITIAMREKIGLALGLKLKQLENYSIASKKERVYQKIDLSTFEILGDWYHYAILELIKVEDFRPEIKWISNSLSITTQEVRRAVSNLQRTGLLEITSDNQWIDKATQGLATNISPGVTGHMAKQMQSQILDLSKQALHEIPLEMRDHTSLTVAINKTQLDEAREKIKKLRRELDVLFSSTPAADDVYQVSISLFPVTKLKRRKP